MNFLVLGGNGFIGSHLVDQLLETGSRVRVYDHSPGHFRPTVPLAEYTPGELGDRQRLLEALAGVDVVFHLIGTTLPATSNQEPAEDVRSNVIGSIGLLDACVDARVRRVVFLSSGGTVYGSARTLPIPEDHPTNPICSYGITKLAIEKYLALYRHLYGLDYLVLRGSNAYGERQRHDRGQGAVAVFLHRLRQHEPVTIWGDGTAVRDYIYAADLARALLLAGLAQQGEQRVYNVGSGRGVSINELVATIEEVTGEKLEVHSAAGRPADVERSVLDIRAIATALHWAPSATLAEGIQRTWRWMKTL